MVQQVYFKVSSVKGVPITYGIKCFRLDNREITYPYFFVLLSLSNENCRIRFRAENRIFSERASI